MQEPAPAGIAPWLHFVHVAMVLVYAGGVIVIAHLLGALAASPAETRAATAAIARRAYLRLILPFGILMVGSGLWLLIGDPEGRGYLKQPTFHVKLTLVAVLMVTEHLLVIRPLKRIATGGAEATRGSVLQRAAEPVVVLLVFAILFVLFVLRGPTAG